MGVQRQATDLDRDLGLGPVPAVVVYVVEIVELVGVVLAHGRLTVAAVIASASSIGATSWTRNTRAPRRYASTLVAIVAAIRSSTGLAGDLAQKRLTGGAECDRSPERHDLVQPAEQLEVVLSRLAEADPGVEQDPLLGHPMRDRERHPLLEERLDLGYDIVVARILLHRPRLTEHVHQAAVDPRRGDHVGHRRVPP